MKKYIIVLILAGVTTFAFSQTKEEDIIKLLEVSNTKALAFQALDMIIPQMEQIVPGVPDNFWTLMREKVDLDGFIKGYVPIYDKHYTHEEIKALIEFYESPIGRRLAEESSAMLDESMEMGMEWGMILGQQIMMELQKSGYLNT